MASCILALALAGSTLPCTLVVCTGAGRASSLWQVCTAEKAPALAQPEKSVVEPWQSPCIALGVRAISYQRPE